MTPLDKKEKLIDIGEIPTKDTRDGLLVRFDRDTQVTTEFAVANINKGQRFYEPPEDSRKIIAVYKLLAPNSKEE